MLGTMSVSAVTYLDAMQQVLRAVDPLAIDAFADLIFRAWQGDRRVFVFGNGGSACTASHYTLDLVKTASVDGCRRLRCFSLSDHGGLITALANDSSYDETFLYPLMTYARAGDVAVAISCSGNSPNVLKACAWARANDLLVVCVSGFSGGRMAAYADLHVNVPHDNYGVIEDVHLSVGHIVAQQLRARVLAEAGR
jgi:D-sedoheptulose 7-phosphate isomerase